MINTLISIQRLLKSKWLMFQFDLSVSPPADFQNFGEALASPTG
jgi:hypothetical protein